MPTTLDTPAARRPPVGPATDEELFRRFRDAGDSRAFEDLVHRYEQPLYGYLRRYLGSADLAEDVFQATFLRIHAKRDRFVDGHAFRPWLYAIATHKAIDTHRHERRHRHVDYPAGGSAGRDGAGLLDAVAWRGRSPDEQAGDGEDRRLMQAAVRRLSEVQRRAVELVYGQGLAYREAADVLGVPVGTVKSRLHSALLALARVWGVHLRRPAVAAKAV
ncbi:MAG: RNA polymerase sigma factor [Planctomycetia bacterium]|nr:RNA polymerase sigma factor [Planctomycetia bacterium]